MRNLFVYRGIRIRKLHLHIYGLYQFLLMIPFFVGAGCYGYFILFPYVQLNNAMTVPALVIQVAPLLGILLGGFFVVKFLTRISFARNGFFNRVKERQLLANMIRDNRFFRTKKKRVTRNKRMSIKEVTIYPRIYYRNKKNVVSVFFPLDGSRNQEKYLKMGSFLENMFLADNMGLLNHKGFIEYRLLSNVEGSRLDVQQMKVTDNKIELMRHVFWNFIDSPHLLIGGGTGGGKTYTMMSLILALLPIAQIEICDPKDADLASLERLLVFKDKVFTGKKILGCMRRGVDDMIRRYQYMKNHPKYVMGKNYAYYGLPPKFIFIDEWAAFIIELESMEDGYKLRQEAIAYLTQLILKGRQSGIFVVLAMQRPDGEYMPTALRDNFMFRMSVGQLSAVGYLMIFGDTNKDKVFKIKNGVKGHGYLGEGGMLAQEYYSAFVPADFSFVEAYSKFKEQVQIDLSDIELSAVEKRELLSEMEVTR